MPVPGGRFRGPPLSAGAAARVPPPRRARRGGGERGPECFRGSAPPSSILAAPSPAACRPAPRPGPAPLRRRAPRSRVPPPNFQKLRRHFLTYLAQRRRRRRGGPGAAPRSSVPGSAAARAPGPARRRAGGGVWARRGAGRLFNLAAAPGIVWGVRGSAARERMEGAGATWRPPGAARSPGRGATSAGRPRRAAPRGVNKALRMRAPLLPPSPPRPSGRGAPALRGRAEESAGRGRAAGGGAAAGFIHGAGSGDRRAKEESVREGRCCPRARMRSSELLSGGARCPSERSPHAGGTARFGTAPSTCSSHLPTQFVLCFCFFFSRPCAMLNALLARDGCVLARGSARSPAALLPAGGLPKLRAYM